MVSDIRFPILLTADLAGKALLHKKKAPTVPSGGKPDHGLMPAI
jgi:hypothetical protein